MEASQPPAVLARRSSDCEPWRTVIEQKIELGLSAQRIYQDLSTEHGFQGSYFSVRRFVRHLCGDSEPARCAASSANRVKRHRSISVSVRLWWVSTASGAGPTSFASSSATPARRTARRSRDRRQTTSFAALRMRFIISLVLPDDIVLDNLRAAVKKVDWFEPELNPKVRAFAAHYGTVFLPARPYRPTYKGKVERGVGYVQDNALKGRTFQSLEAENLFLLEWEQTVADTRLHGTTRHQVGKLFHDLERRALLPLPLERFPFFHEGQPHGPSRRPCRG